METVHHKNVVPLGEVSSAKPEGFQHVLVCKVFTFCSEGS